jgi:predicted DNA-binding protein with PD1-like motif
MQYTEAKLGRVFYLRVDHGEDLLASLQNFVTEKKISAGFIHILGALREGSIVTGPKVPVLPPDPLFDAYEGGWEVLGLGSITERGGQPHIHLHASVGRGREALTGCLRKKAVVYIVIEAVIIELVGARIFRRSDPATGLELPEPGNIMRP